MSFLGQIESKDFESPAAKAAIAAAVAAAKMGPKDLSMNSLGPELKSANYSTSNGTIHSRVMIRKQRTTESAPTSHHFLMSAGGPTLRQIPRQQSTASAYSMAIPSTYSHQGITLVRGASCSLVDIPTYLGPAAVGIAGNDSSTNYTGFLENVCRILDRFFCKAWI